jgi:MFS family permease
MTLFGFYRSKAVERDDISAVDADGDDPETDSPSSSKAPEKRIPYPSAQLFVLGCCRLSEPISMLSSSPYLYFMIRDFHVTDNEQQIGRYAGFLASCYSFGQFLTGTDFVNTFLMIGILWGRLSDRVGRKPIVLSGLLGTVLATLVFGFSSSYAQAIVARSIAGLLNGNMGVVRTMVGEMEVDRLDQARAFSVMPFVGNLGSILGPVLGGAYPTLSCG